MIVIYKKEVDITIRYSLSGKIHGFLKTMPLSILQNSKNQSLNKLIIKLKNGG